MGMRRVAAGALSIALGMLCASPALAGETTRSKATADAEGSKKVCKNLTHTGTRLSRRTCKRQSEWALDAARARRNLDELRAQGLRSNIDGQ